MTVCNGLSATRERQRRTSDERDLETIVIATYPPIPKKMCMRCGWCWEGKPEEIVRITFKDQEVNDET